MADSNIKAAPSLGDKPDTLAASVDNTANEDAKPQPIEGLVLGAPVIFTGISHHPLVEGIAERAGIVSKLIDDVEGVAIITVFTNDPTRPVSPAQARYTKEVGSHGTFRLVSDVIAEEDAAEVTSPSSAGTAKRGSSNTGNGG